jgi:uncharacterized protein (TIGR00369 family)
VNSPKLTARDPDFERRVRASFARQTIMETIGARLEHVAPGETEIVLGMSPGILQQHGFVHAGVVATIADSAAGYAALSLMPPGAGVLTAEFKINLMAPAAGDRLIARGSVIKAGRTLTVAQAVVEAETGGTRRTVALLTATLMAMENREGVLD